MRCQFAQKTIQYVRAPDENVFIPPFNLIEIFGLVVPFEWWMASSTYERLNNYIMGTIYSPLLLITAALETRTARHVRHNRKRGHDDEDNIQEWEQAGGDMDFESDGWGKRVEMTKPNVETDATLIEVRELRQELKELKEMVGRMSREGTPA